MWDDEVVSFMTCYRVNVLMLRCLMKWWWVVTVERRWIMEVWYEVTSGDGVDDETVER